MRIPSLSHKQGFILLFAILTISFVLAITLSLADSIRKQYDFAAFGSDSLRALGESNSGLECALYWDRKRGGFSPTAASQITCMGQTFTVGGSNVSSFTLQDTSVTPPRQIVVVVDKSVTGTTTISTTGYSTSNAGDKRQVNRTTALSYSTLSEQCDDVEVILALDTSSSILIADRGKLETAALSFVNGLSPSQGGAHVGLVSFNREASLVLPLNYNATLFPSAIHNAIIFPYWGTISGTNMPGALRHATIELNQNSRPTSGRFIVVITDGATNRCSYLSGADYFCPGGILPPDRDEGQNRTYSANQARDYATLAKGDGTDPDDIKIIAVGVGISSTLRHPDGRPYDQYLRDDIASDQQYFSVDGFGDLEEALEQLNCAYFTVRKGTPLYREN